ncbi:hypothetical protein RCO28_04800 [Streptomyces sp. LHD-70]|uniref:hypothetical protein n=1 Tax=Streptomyces sp. LHD-70 TaxID=3072140 RepID=UPI00280C405F|nr:hypothetical protein [Streptomyces sp. LHD-70]MDQ8701812.1 hypothetical protein [Streptomyces sp. LHD-70]
MRSPRPLPSVLAGLALLVCLPVSLPSEAASHPATSAVPEAERPFGADCRVRQAGSNVVAYCHNPYPEADRVALHIECRRWWDIDTDTARVAAGPAMTVRLAGRCWKEVGSAWVSHER